MSSHDVFICYSARDKTVATAICAVLEAEGVRCWMAPRDIVPGADWGESIIDAINDARAMVLVFSSNANDAQQQIKREVERAVNKSMPVIPFRIENVMPTKSLEYFLSTPHWLDAFTPPLDDHVRQLADSIKRLLGKQVAERPVLVKPASSAPTLAALAHHYASGGGEGFKIGGVPLAEWIKVPRHAAIAAGAALVVILALWFVFRPTAKPEDQQAWNVAAMEDSIPGYELYMREMPSGYFAGKAESRVSELKAEVDNAFTKAKAANTPAAYTSFLNTYAKQGVDLDEARNAYANADAQESAVRVAYNTVRQTRSRAGYQGFLAQYGTSTYAPDVRQRIAACRTQTQTSGDTQSSQLSRSATGSGNTVLIACQEARNTVQSEIQNTCLASHGRISGARVVSQNAQNVSSAGGRVVGSLLGGALFGRNQNNVNLGSVYQCAIQAAAVCEKSVSSSRQVDVCP
jgi:TIR domain